MRWCPALGLSLLSSLPHTQVKEVLAVISLFYVEFIVGVCMLAVVTWLALFRMKEIKECWRTHVRIRYYFCLTLLGTAVNLTLGACGTAFTFTLADETK